MTIFKAVSRLLLYLFILLIVGYFLFVMGVMIE